MLNKPWDQWTLRELVRLVIGMVVVGFIGVVMGIAVRPYVARQYADYPILYQTLVFIGLSAVTGIVIGLIMYVQLLLAEFMSPFSLDVTLHDLYNMDVLEDNPDDFTADEPLSDQPSADS